MSQWVLLDTLVPPNQESLVQDFTITPNGDIYVSLPSKNKDTYFYRYVDGSLAGQMVVPNGGHADLLYHRVRVDTVYLVYRYQGASASHDDSGRWVEIPFIDGKTWSDAEIVQYYCDPPKMAPSNRPGWIQGEETVDDSFFRYYGVAYGADNKPTPGANGLQMPAFVQEINSKGKQVRRIDASMLGRSAKGYPIDGRLEPEGIAKTVIDGLTHIVVGVVTGVKNNFRFQLWAYPVGANSDGTALPPAGGSTPTVPTPLPPVPLPGPPAAKGGLMVAPSVTKVYGDKGHFRVDIRHPDGRSTDITQVRGVPVVVQSLSSADPFGDATAVLNFPMVSSFDTPGAGDLWWMVPWASVTITWYVKTDDSRWAQDPEWVWEGFLVSEDMAQDLSWQCKGALYMADNFQAAPFYPQYPVPYEKLIQRGLDPLTHPTLKLKSLKVEWPANWETFVPAFDEPSYLWFLRPWGVSKGQKWSGLTTRSTGSWEPTLTGHIQTLLSTMFTPEGDQWTLMKRPGRTPVLQVRSPLRDDPDALVVFNGAPGVQVSLSRDFSQSANVIYGSGTDLAGTTFSGAQVTTDGETTYYEPFAALPQVHPNTGSNPRLIPTMTRKESRITFSPGIDEVAARDAAATQIKRFADPGYVGSVILDSDPFQGGEAFNRMLVRAGSQLLVKNYRGGDLLLHVSQVDVSVPDGSTTLTVDSKFRDALTVAEVRARTRDALDPVNLLQVGKQSSTVPDLLKPWSYAEGSGVIPSGSNLDATALFKKMDTKAAFPWVSWTTKYPPKSHPKSYIKVSKKGPKADDRWQDNGYTTKTKRSRAVPVKGAQTATIRLLQIGAYDVNGNPKKVRFHVSIYTNSGVTSSDMPTIPKGLKGQPYPAGQHYPFFPGAFEQYEANGQEQDNPGVLLPEGADLVAGWGNNFDPAGYSPGLYSAGGKKTGLLVDESSWTFDTSNDPGFDKYSVKNNAKNKSAGMLYLMIFCDDTDDDVYFLGRMFHVPAGSS